MTPREWDGGISEFVSSNGSIRFGSNGRRHNGMIQAGGKTPSNPTLVLVNHERGESITTPPKQKKNNKQNNEKNKWNGNKKQN